MSKLEIIVENGVVTNKSIASEIVKAVDAGKHIGVGCTYTSKEISKIIIVTDDNTINKKKGVIKQGHCFLGEISQNDALELKLDIEDGNVPQKIVDQVKQCIRKNRGEKEEISEVKTSMVNEIFKVTTEGNEEDLATVIKNRGEVTGPVVQQNSEINMQKQSAGNNERKDKQTKKNQPIASEVKRKEDIHTKGKLAELVNNPLYQSRKEKDGHHVIAESANSDLKIKVYGEGGKSDLTKGAYIYAKTHTKTGKARKISLADISKGGTTLMNFMLEFGNAFTMADISIANNRLWLLNELGKLNIIDLEPRLDMKGIHAFFMKKIAQGFEGLDIMTIYAEEVEGRIDVGIWQDVFDAYWEEIADDTDIDKRAWCKQAKALGWLLPDKGRGGGQHTPSAVRSKAYGRKETDRIQRFLVTKEQAEDWVAKRSLQRMISVGGNDHV